MKRVALTGVLSLAGVALCAALLATGCGTADKPGGATPGTAQGGGKAEKTFVMVPKGVHPYYEPCYDGFKDAGAKLGVKVDFCAAKEFQVAQQVQMIENVIARKVDGIAISALDDQGLGAVIEDATKAGIKVITFDAPAPSSKALCYIGTANEAAGYAGGEAVAALMNGEGEIAVLQGGLAAPNLNDRYKGFEKALKEKAPNIKIVTREDTEGKANVTADKTEALLRAYPKLKAIFSVSAEGVPGAVAVLKDAKQTDKVLLAGFDDLPDTLKGIRDGSVRFCIVQRTYLMGWLAVEKLLDACNGKEVPKLIDTGVIIVNKENVNTYMQDMKKAAGK
ncbi:MAG: sugar-binding protein [Planctomycetota bacterium]|nr:sugar-binding protein [Planctomycetota bacterium]